MRSYSLIELFSLTRNELYALRAEITADLARLPENSPDRLVALENLRLIRAALGWRGPAP